MNNVVKVSPQMKTIKFEARPMWETALFAKKFSGDDSLDAVRKESYGKVKDILDNHARFVIDMATRMVASENLLPTYDNLRELYFASRDRKNKDAVGRYEKAVKDFKNHVVEVVKNYATEYQLAKAQGDLFSPKKSCLLNGVADMELTDEEENLILLYNGFTGYFSKYFDSLSKTILCGVEHGSIANRVIENMERYFQNEKVLADIKENHPALYEDKDFASNVALMKVSYCLSQEGVDAYNMLLGDTCNSGLNSLINAYRQKNKVRVLGLKQLDKIPLCKKEKQVIVEKIETNEELASVISDSLPLVERLISYAKSVMETSLSMEDMEGIFVKTSLLSNLSMDIYGRWDKLQRLVDSYVNDNGLKQEEVVSLALLEKVIRMEEGGLLDGETVVRGGVMDVVKNKLAEAVTAKMQIPSMKELCRLGDVLSQKKTVKEFYEKLLLIRQTLRVFDLDKVENAFVEDLLSAQDMMREVNSIYNMVRNFCTKNPVKKDTYPVSFNKCSCLSSFDYDKFADGVSISSILRKDGHYYLLILNPEYSSKLPVEAKTEDGAFEQLVYKQLTGLNKMFPKVFLAKSNQEIYAPSDRVLEIAQKKLYTKEAGDRDACVEWIRFCIDSFKKNADWMKNFNPVFRNPEEYVSANEFYTELEKCTIRMDFSERLDETYLRSAVRDGKVFLFELYNKDFSPYHHGKDGAFTRLFKEMFSEENLNKINHSDETAIKLASGGSELTFRKASLPYKETHPANEPIANKNPLNEKKESVFTYALCKDKRFMTDKFFLSLAIQVGFRNNEVNRYELNRRVNEQVLEKLPNMLSVRVAERHLLYYVVTSPDGEILEQGSLNVIRSGNGTQEVKTDYKQILTKRETEIMEAKEAWDYSKDIKNIKEGYLSQAIHTIVKLQEKYDAVIFLEDYSGTFVQKRMKNLKNVYQQFQKALLQKLSCFVPEGKGFADAICLACPVSSLDDLKGQSGIVYFVNPSYTANVDPATGFANQYYEAFVYESVKKAKDTVSKITDIQFDEDNQDFAITISEKDFGVSSLDKKWVLHTRGVRTIFKDKKYQEYDCTANMKQLFAEYGISSFEDMKTKDLNKRFYEQFFEIVSVMFRIHYYIPALEEEYVLSPVENKDGICFNSQMGKSGKPLCSAVIKTYLMGVKGLRDLQGINKETLFVERDEKGTHKDKWLDFLQTSVSLSNLF